MRTVGQVESLWRYPVKSMRGEELPQAFIGFAGVYGDRVYAFTSSAAQKGFPYLTGREKEELLLYRPAYRHAMQMLKPPNLPEAEALAPGITPVYPDAADLIIDVQTPSGDQVAIDDPSLIDILRQGLRDRHELKLVWSHRPMTDCRPVSLFSLQTAQQLSRELATTLDKRRFRANIYCNLESQHGFAEDEFVGRKLQIGTKTVIAPLTRDPRCKMITLDPDTAEANPEVMRLMARDHEGKAGVYAAVLVEGTISPGDTITLLEQS
jgi:uncharacterized protein YcbX